MNAQTNSSDEYVELLRAALKYEGDVTVPEPQLHELQANTSMMQASAAQSDSD